MNEVDYNIFFLGLDVNDLLDEYIAVHNEVVKIKLSRIIPFMSEEIPYDVHLDKITEIKSE